MYQPALKVIQFKVRSLLRPPLYVVLTLSLLYAPNVLAQMLPSDQNGIGKALRVKVINIRQLKGQMMLAVYDRREDFLTDKVVMSTQVPVSSSEVVMDLDSLIVQHQYVISIYHDVNGNGELDTNIMSIPVEPYGFSNNNLGLVPIPNYEKSTFTMHEQLDAIEIELRGG